MKISWTELLDLVNLNNFLYSVIWVTAENVGDTCILEVGGRFETKWEKKHDQ